MYVLDKMHQEASLVVGCFVTYLRNGVGTHDTADEEPEDDEPNENWSESTENTIVGTYQCHQNKDLQRSKMLAIRASFVHRFG